MRNFFNPYEVSARAVKVSKMANVIKRMRQPHRDVIVEMILRGDLDAFTHALLVRAAGINWPSETTMRALQLRLVGGVA